jgi:uncharacterized protein YaeQ
MAIKPTILKAQLDISDMDRHHYDSHTLSLARHSSETDERLMVRLMAYALHAHENLSFTDGIDSADDPALWQKDLTGTINLWIDVGQPDEKRIIKACGRADEVVVYAYAKSALKWWEQTAPKVERAKNLSVIHFLDSGSVARLVQRSMSFQCLIQDGQIFLTSGEENFEVELVKLRAG